MKARAPGAPAALGLGPDDPGTAAAVAAGVGAGALSTSPGSVCCRGAEQGPIMSNQPPHNSTPLGTPPKYPGIRGHAYHGGNRGGGQGKRPINEVIQ